MASVSHISSTLLDEQGSGITVFFVHIAEMQSVNMQVTLMF